eukprot:351290-Chlamydomonas_euryale.AAC.5
MILKKALKKAPSGAVVLVCHHAKRTMRMLAYSPSSDVLVGMVGLVWHVGWLRTARSGAPFVKGLSPLFDFLSSCLATLNTGVPLVGPRHSDAD